MKPGEHTNTRLSFGPATLAVAIAVSLALIGTYLALGGASYKPVEVADPCKPRPIEKPQGGGEVLQQVALSALDGAACELGVSREDLTLALADRNSRDRFLREHGVTDQAFEQALRAGLLRAVDDAQPSRCALGSGGFDHSCSDRATADRSGDRRA